MAHDIMAVDIRHMQVEQDQIVLLMVEAGDGFLAADSSIGFHTAYCEQILEAFQDDRVIVYD
jgi:light-regulated signal transduction histidine kinase (bacteriophytochrome)